MRQYDRLFREEINKLVTERIAKGLYASDVSFQSLSGVERTKLQEQAKRRLRNSRLV